MGEFVNAASLPFTASKIVIMLAAVLGPDLAWIGLQAVVDLGLCRQTWIRTLWKHTEDLQPHSSADFLVQGSSLPEISGATPTYAVRGVLSKFAWFWKAVFDGPVVIKQCSPFGDCFAALLMRKHRGFFTPAFLDERVPVDNAYPGNKIAALIKITVYLSLPFNDKGHLLGDDKASPLAIAEGGLIGGLMKVHSPPPAAVHSHRGPGDPVTPALTPTLPVLGAVILLVPITSCSAEVGVQAMATIFTF